MGKLKNKQGRHNTQLRGSSLTEFLVSGAKQNGMTPTVTTDRIKESEGPAIKSKRLDPSASCHSGRQAGATPNKAAKSRDGKRRLANPNQALS